MLTTAAGKRLIGKALAAHPEIQKVLKKGTLIIIAGTTNSFVAEEIFPLIGETSVLNRRGFFRGVTLPPSYKMSETGRLPDESKFIGDIVIQNGVWLKGKTIDDVARDLREGDVILKGANALDLTQKRAAILIGSPTGGTALLSLQAVIGHRVRLIIPVGLEKRIFGDLDDLARKLNSPGIKGHRLLPIPGEVFTEIEALSVLTGATAELFASGGVCGAEGTVWLAISGSAEQENAAEKILKSIENEPAFKI
jgi:hypothetical protein